LIAPGALGDIDGGVIMAGNMIGTLLAMAPVLNP
jgi:hypothetical protein